MKIILKILFFLLTVFHPIIEVCNFDEHILRIYNSIGGILENKNLLEGELIEFESTIGYVGSW